MKKCVQNAIKYTTNTKIITGPVGFIGEITAVSNGDAVVS